MKKIIVTDTRKTVTELFKKKWLGDCEKQISNDSLESYFDVICDDKEEAQVISAFLTQKGFTNGWQLEEWKDTGEYHISAYNNSSLNYEKHSQMFHLIRDNFKFITT